MFMILSPAQIPGGPDGHSWFDNPQRLSPGSRGWPFATGNFGWSVNSPMPPQGLNQQTACRLRRSVPTLIPGFRPEGFARSTVKPYSRWRPNTPKDPENLVQPVRLERPMDTGELVRRGIKGIFLTLSVRTTILDKGFLCRVRACAQFLLSTGNLLGFCPYFVRFFMRSSRCHCLIPSSPLQVLVSDGSCEGA